MIHSWYRLTKIAMKLKQTTAVKPKDLFIFALPAKQYISFDT